MRKITMITMICGLIGAGKTTYASKRFPKISDLDFMSGWTKSDQIKMTLKMHEKGENIAHISCYPTIEETVMIKNLPPDEIHFIWIDTPPIQCRKNIIKRGRLNDLQDLGHILQVNAELYARLSSSPIHFERVKVFEMNERW